MLENIQLIKIFILLQLYAHYPTEIKIITPRTASYLLQIPS